MTSYTRRPSATVAGSLPAKLRKLATVAGLTAAVAMPLTLATAIPAPAAPANEAVSAEALKSRSDGTYCTVILPKGSQHCEATLNAQISWLTKGQITNIQSDQDLTTAKWKDIEKRAARYVLGTFYEDDNYNDSRITYTASRPCYVDGRRDFSVSSLTGKWNDQFGSFRGYSNCSIMVYEHANFEGARTPLSTEMRSLGALDDEGSSIEFY
jgi:hypothetical protein